jgi:serine/threonine protein kinase
VPDQGPGLRLLVTRTGAAAGTLTHMAPEQFDDVKRVDVRADVYSFGVMLYQMATGRLPFRGRSAVEYMRLHQEAKVPSPGTAIPAFNALVERCLAKDPADRYEDFSRVRAALEEAAFERTEEGVFESMQLLVRHLSRKLKKIRGTAEAREVKVTLRCLRKALARGPSPPSTDWVREGASARPDEGLLDKAASLAELGRPGPALAVLDEWLASHSDDGKAHAQRGILLMNALHNYREALASLERARELGHPGLEKRIAFCRHKLV